MKENPKAEKPAPVDTVVDTVNEASQESFPASDAPSWTVASGEKEDTQLGCTTSFIMEERGEIGGICDQQPDPKEQYVQPDKEKEAGGEG